MARDWAWGCYELERLIATAGPELVERVALLLAMTVMIAMRGVSRRASR